MAELTTLGEAVAGLVHDGDTVGLEGFTYLIPTLSGPRDHPPGAAWPHPRADDPQPRLRPDGRAGRVARKLFLSWGVNPGVGSSHRFRDAVENGWPTPLEVEEPASNALVEIWQADEDGGFATASGIYAQVREAGFRGLGRCATDTEGRYGFQTVKPAGVPTLEGAPQAPHIAMSVFARDMLRRVVTRVYFKDEADANPPTPCSPPSMRGRRATPVASATEDGYVFDMQIQGDDATVFLDVFAR